MAGAAVTAVIGVLATISMRSSNPLSIGGTSVFDILDHATALYLMPLGGLFIVLFVGWYMKKTDTMAELTNEGTLRSGIRKAILLVIRYLCPLAIAVIFISQLIK